MPSASSGESGPALFGSQPGDAAIGAQHVRRLVDASALGAVVAISIVAYWVEGTYLAPFLVAFGFTLALVDTAFGMGYGTLATPILLVVGFQPIAVVPAVLLSQALAATFATTLHVRYKNVNLLDLKGNDARISIAIIAFGVIGVFAAVVLAVQLPSLYVKAYIGVLVVVVGFFLLARPHVRFSWPKVYTISVVNGFDKAISGGGFGPVAVGGLLALGQRIRNSIGIAVFSATVINFAAVGLYFGLHTSGAAELSLMATLSAGAIIGALIGPGITGSLNTKGHLSGLAYLIIAIGALALLTTFVLPIHLAFTP
jgi:uncharacterized protein